MTKLNVSVQGGMIRVGSVSMQSVFDRLFGSTGFESDPNYKIVIMLCRYVINRLYLYSANGKVLIKLVCVKMIP